MNRRTAEIILAALLFIAGGAVLFWPRAKGAELQKASDTAAESFIESVEEHAEPDEKPQKTRRNAELFEAMQEYNREIFLSGQSGLTGPDAYEAEAIAPEDYGIEDGVIAVLSIDSLELVMPVYMGADESNMAKGAAILGQTSLPTGDKDCNCVIAGHRGWSGAPYFRYIDALQPGDEVRITNLWETLSYTVSEIKIIEPNDIKQILIRPGKDMLTLLTCHPYASGGRYRYLVFCERAKK